MKLTCKKTRKLIRGYVEHHISDRELTALLAHVEGCRSCYNELESSFLIRYALDFLDRDERGGLDIQVLLEEDLKKSRKRLKRHRHIRFLLTVLAVVVVFLIASVLISLIFTEYFGEFGQFTRGALNIITERF